MSPCGCGGSGSGSSGSVVFEVRTPDGKATIYTTSQEARQAVALTGGSIRAVKRVT